MVKQVLAAHLRPTLYTTYKPCAAVAVSSANPGDVEDSSTGPFALLFEWKSRSRRALSCQGPAALLLEHSCHITTVHTAAGLVQRDSPLTMSVRRTARSRRGSHVVPSGSQQPYGRSPDPPTQATTASPCPSMDPASFPLGRSHFSGAFTPSQIQGSWFEKP